MKIISDLGVALAVIAIIGFVMSGLDENKAGGAFSLGAFALGIGVIALSRFL